MHEAQTKLQALLEQVVAEGRERGVQVTVYHQGKLVIDAFAGVTDASGKKKVVGSTLFPIFSCTKGFVATLAHLLVERGKISYDTPIAEVWPEFAAEGKGNILFRHALNHSSGLQFMPAGVKPADLLDWDTICGLIAKQKPASAPGAVVEYHPVTFGWIVGEVLRRVDGRPFPQLLKDEICEPLNAPDLYVGLPPSEDSRMAELEEIFPPDTQFPELDDPTPAGVSPFMRPLHAWMNRVEGRRALVPGSSGIATARDMARHYAALVPGGVDGVELLPPARIRQAAQLAIASNDPINGNPKRIGLGYYLGGDPNGMGSRTTIFGHGGYGGAMGYADPEMGLAVGLTKNLYSSRQAQNDIFRAVRESLGIPH